MGFMPARISSILVLATVYFSGYRHWRLKKPNTGAILQVIMMGFALVMMLMVTLYNRVDSWLSLAFLIVAVGDLGLLIRQHRGVPPMHFD
jgi:hypothetical protein